MYFSRPRPLSLTRFTRMPFFRLKISKTIYMLYCSRKNDYRHILVSDKVSVPTEYTLAFLNTDVTTSINILM